MSAKPIKKSFNTSQDLMQQLDEIMAKNPGLNLTFIVNQALAQWIQKPSINVSIKEHTTEDVDAFISKHQSLMDKLGS